jgi:coenzyme F420-dependent glucose-6-phosphate dehydrogenase
VPPIQLGYFAELEKNPNPRLLLQDSVKAEAAGFDAIWASDHFHPWIHTGAGCGFTWVWLSALAENTKKIQIGTAVTAQILRYDPALVAQAFATLGVMYPNRIFLTLATGEAMNEVPIGRGWPKFRERAERLEEAVRVIRTLWTEDFATFDGKYYKLKNANLYTKPEKPIPLYVAANVPTVASLAGKYGDGILTLETFDKNYYASTLFPAFERGAKSAGRDPHSLPKMIELNVSYDEDYDKALEACRPWSTIKVSDFYRKPVYDPREIEAHSKSVDMTRIEKLWLVGPSIDEHIKKIEEYIKIGFTNFHFCSWSPSEDEFIKVYSKQVLPYLRERYS